MENKLPKNDKDLILAQKIGQEGIEGINDEPILNDLLAYRKSCNNQGLSIEADGSEVWSQIEKETAPARVYYLSPRLLQWAAAACLLVATISAVFFLRMENQPSLLAETGSQIETIQLQDGSEVTLRPHSRLYEVQVNSSQHRYQLQGEGYFSVETSEGRTFSVETAQGRVEVIGTRFVVRDWGQFTEVFLEEGSILLESIDRANSIILEPGQSSAISLIEGLRPPQLANINEYLDWTRNELFFQSRTARFVFNELEHHFQITINAPDRIMEDVLGGAISLESLSQSLNDLGAVLNGNFVTNDNKMYTFIPE